MRASLAERGFAVRSTFIDGPAEWFDVPRSSRRARSTPPSCSASAEVDTFQTSPRADCSCKVRSASPARSDASTSTGSLPSQEDQGSPLSETHSVHNTLSSPLSEIDSVDDRRSQPSQTSHSRLREADLYWLHPQSASACVSAADRLAQLVEQECGFLRLNGHMMRPDSSDKARRQGVALALRFFVRGLPAAKRAKWQQPLCWAAAGVLQRFGLDARMQGGELQVQLEHGKCARVEFMAGRL
jgi:hypothetical protein